MGHPAKRPVPNRPRAACYAGTELDPEAIRTRLVQGGMTRFGSRAAAARLISERQELLAVNKLAGKLTKVSVRSAPAAGRALAAGRTPCSAHGCSTVAPNGGRCDYHSRSCVQAGCTARPTRTGYCKKHGSKHGGKHGGGRVCTFHGCPTRLAAGGAALVCRKHADRLLSLRGVQKARGLTTAPFGGGAEKK